MRLGLSTLDWVGLTAAVGFEDPTPDETPFAVEIFSGFLAALFAIVLPPTVTSETCGVEEQITDGSELDGQYSSMSSANVSR